MDDDKYKAVWLSYSGMKDFTNCPRAYYYRYVYKNPRTGKKISIAKPALSLGQTVHGVLDQISTLPSANRFSTPLANRFEQEWKLISGRKGGFSNAQEESMYKQRGMAMIDRIAQNPGILMLPAVKMKDQLPYYWISKDENLILCGKIDWLQYDQETDSVQIIDFKTGKGKEHNGSLQLPIYYLLATHCQKRAVAGASYWYLESDNNPISVDLPNEKDSEKQIMDIGLRLKLARQLNHFKCISDDKMGCRYCAPLQAVVEGKGEFVGNSQWGDEIYYLSSQAVSLSTGSPRTVSMDIPDEEE